MISPGIFFIFFFNFKFLGCWLGQRTKNDPTLQKVLSVALHISGTIHHMNVIDSLWYTCVKLYLQAFFFIFSKFWFYRLFWQVRGQKMIQNDKKILPVTLHISGAIYHTRFSLQESPTTTTQKFAHSPPSGKIPHPVDSPH